MGIKCMHTPTIRGANNRQLARDVPQAFHFYRFSLPEAILIHLHNFSRFIENTHDSSHESVVFRNQDGTQVASASTISGMLKRGWEQS